MSDITGLPRIPTISRRTAIKTIANLSTGFPLMIRVAACAPWPNISSSRAHEPTEPQEPPGMLNEIYDSAVVDLRRRKYGIISPISSPYMSAYLKTIHPQEFPLSCEIASLSDLLAIYGHHIHEKDILKTLPVSEDPTIGRHPLLTDYTSPKNKPGFTPPDPWGVLAHPLAQAFNNAFTARTGLCAEYTDNNHDPFENIIQFTNFLNRNLSGNNFPIVWYINADHLHPPINFNGNTYYADEHAGMITGISASNKSAQYVEILDPVSVTPYYFNLNDIFDGNQRCCSNTLSLYTK